MADRGSAPGRRVTFVRTKVTKNRHPYGLDPLILRGFIFLRLCLLVFSTLLRRFVMPVPASTAYPWYTFAGLLIARNTLLVALRGF